MDGVNGLEVLRRDGAITIQCRNGKRIKAIDMLPEIIGDDENLQMCLNALNANLKHFYGDGAWPQYPVTIEQVRAPA